MADKKGSTLLVGVVIVLLIAVGISLAWTLGSRGDSPAAMEFERAKATPEEAPERVLGSGPVAEDAPSNARLGSEEPVIRPEEPTAETPRRAKPRKDAPRARSRSPKPVEPEEDPVLDDAAGAKKKPPMG